MTPSGRGHLVAAMFGALCGATLLAIGLAAGDASPAVHWGWMVCGALMLLSGLMQMLGAGTRRRPSGGRTPGRR